MPLSEDARRVAELLTSEAYVRLLAAATPEGVASGTLLALALEREGVDFHLSFLPEVDSEAAARLRDEKHAVALLLDLPVVFPAETASLASAVVRLDRHRGIGDAPGALDLTAESLDVDGASECTAATFAYAVARTLNRRNVDLFPLALAAARLEGQHFPAWRGLNAEFLGESVEAGAIAVERRLALDGGNLVEALSQGVDPYFAGFAGRARHVVKWLTDLSLPPEAPLDSLDAHTTERVASALALRLAESDREALLDLCVGGDLVARDGPFRGAPLRDLSRRLLAATALDPSLLLASVTKPLSAPDSREVRERLLQTLLRAERDGARAEPAASSSPRAIVMEVRDAALLAPAVTHAFLAHAARVPVLAFHKNGKHDRVELRRPRTGAGDAWVKSVEALAGRARHHGAGGSAVLPSGAADALVAALTGAPP